jgi:hypothetical protein
VRGTLCPALKALFEHGLKKPSLLGGACHPWLFIEEVSHCLSLEGTKVPTSGSSFSWAHCIVLCACLDPVALTGPFTVPILALSWLPQAAGREVERDFDSVYSRLVLCKTYR